MAINNEKIERIRVFTTGCRGCRRKYMPHKILTGWDGHELDKIYIQCCMCNKLTEVTNVSERQIKDIEKCQ